MKLTEQLKTKIQNEPMLKNIQNEAIIEIYIKIQNALLTKGPQIVEEFGVIYQLELSPPPEQMDDPNFVKFYTVDLKNGSGQVILAYERDRDNLEKVPEADSIFIISEFDFVRLYNGAKKTAISFVLQGILKLRGSYPLMVKFYQDFLTSYVKNPENEIFEA